MESENQTPDEQIIVNDHNGWRMWERLPIGAKPRYQWKKTWAKHPSAKQDDDKPDITGFKDGVTIGRAFQLEAIANRDVWFWVLYPPEGVYFWRPISGSGWERSMREAACRVEWCHDEMVRSLENFPQYARHR
jgi:hypothetical protein